MPIVDAAIVGGGPAGLSAALWLARYLRTVVLVDSGDPRNWETRGVNGFLGLPGVTPAELRGRARDEVRRYAEHATLMDGCVQRVDRINDDCFHLALSDGRRLESRRLVLAYGLRDVWPEVPGLERVYGETAHVCPDCDGYEVRGCRTVVIGSGKRAAGMSLKLTTWTQDVTICTNGAPADLPDDAREKIERAGIAVIETRIARLHDRKGELRSLEFSDGTSLRADRIFFTIGQLPADDLALSLGCERDEHHQIIVDAHRHTSLRNVWAAGDLIPGPQLAIAAAADGAIAALSVHKSLVPPERRLD